jgi:hypothetical protein
VKKNGWLAKVLIYLGVTFVIVAVWRDPTGSAEAFGHFLAEVGNFFMTVIDKVAAFFKGLAE